MASGTPTSGPRSNGPVNRSIQPRVARSLRDAPRAIDDIFGLAERIGNDERRFETEDIVRWAIERQFGILGEAIWRVDEMDAELRERIPAIGESIGLRDAIHMGYDAIDPEVAWTTVVEDLRPLRRVIRRAPRRGSARRSIGPGLTAPTPG